MGTRRQLTADIGDTGLGITGGRVWEDFLAEWRGEKKVKLVTEMLSNSPVIAALRMSIERTLLDIDWYFAGPEDVDEDDPALQLLNDSAEAMSHSLKEHIMDAVLFPFYGWSMFTITYQRDGARLLWRKFKSLGHDTLMQWQLAEDGGLTGMRQWPHLNPDPIPIERMVIYRFRRFKNNPEGESILRPAYVPYYYTKHLQEIEAIGVERNLAGLPVVKLPEFADTTETDTATSDWGKAVRLARRIRNDEEAGVVLPFGWELTLLSGGGLAQTKAMDTNMIISRYEKRMLMAALAQFIMLGMDNIGALATFEGGNDFFTMLANSIADVLAETFSKYAVARLLELNGIDPDGYALLHSPAGNIDLAMVTDFLAKAGNSITWTTADEQWLRSLARLPELNQEQIEAAQEEKRQRQAEMMPPAFLQRGQDGDEMAAELFAAGNAPDDDERRRYEGQWQRQMETFLQAQRGRVLKAARAERRGD